MDFRKPSRATVKVRLLNPHSCTHAHTHSQSFPPPGSFILPSVLTTPYDSRMLRDFTAERAEFVPAGRGCAVDKPLVWSWISLRQRLLVIHDVFYVVLLGVHSQSKKKKRKKRQETFCQPPSGVSLQVCVRPRSTCVNLLSDSVWTERNGGNSTKT